MIRQSWKDAFVAMRDSGVSVWSADLYAERFNRSIDYGGRMLSYLAMAGLLERVERGTYKIREPGQ